MPAAAGDDYEATRRTRLLERDSNCHLAFIAMTAYAMKGDRDGCVVDDDLSKPVSGA